MNIKQQFKNLAPAFLVQWYSRLVNGSIKFTGNYSTWQDAKANSTGFQQREILEKVKHAALQVKQGKAMYERDSVVFDKIVYNWPLLACLQHTALANNGTLHIIDFGGSLGTTYVQNKVFLQELKTVQWHVVEQEHYVQAGQADFENEQLHFHYTIEAVLAAHQVNCIILSGCIQYLEDAYDMLRSIVAHKIQYIIFDRTTFIHAPSRISVQSIPKQIYAASFPCWFFNEAEFLQLFENKYDMIADFDGFDKGFHTSDNKTVYWKGFLLKLK